MFKKSKKNILKQETSYTNVAYFVHGRRSLAVKSFQSAFDGLWKKDVENNY